MESRRKLVNDIHRLTDTEGDELYQKKLSATAAHASFTEVTGGDPQPAKGKAWHLKKIAEELETEVRKEMRWNGSTLPQDALKELRNCLQQG